MNGTDAALRALIAAEAEHKSADAALVAAEDAGWREPLPTPTVALPSVTGGEPRRLTLAELRDARNRDWLLLPPDDGTIERSLREMLDRELKLREMQTPEAIAERAALYDRSEAELQSSEAAARPVKPATVARCEAKLIAAEKRAAEAEDALLSAPVLTIEYAVRKLQLALDHHMDPEDYNAQLVASALAGLRRIAGTA